jgi:hypothetical protein
VLKPVVLEDLLSGARDILRGDETDPGQTGFFTDDEDRRRLQVMDETVRLNRLQALAKTNASNPCELRDHLVGKDLPVLCAASARMDQI